MSSLPVPPFLNGHVPNGNDKAKLIDALVTFGQWVKQTTDTARQAAEAAAASVNPQSIINQARLTVKGFEEIASSRWVSPPSGTRLALVLVSGSQAPGYGGNVSNVALPGYPTQPVLRLVGLTGSGSINVQIGTNGSTTSVNGRGINIEVQGSQPVRFYINSSGNGNTTATPGKVSILWMG